MKAKLMVKTIVLYTQLFKIIYFVEYCYNEIYYCRRRM